MRCKLDSTENLRSFEKCPTPPCRSRVCLFAPLHHGIFDLKNEVRGRTLLCYIIKSALCCF